MDFTDFLRTCTKDDGSFLSERTIEHYESGLRVVSNDMIHENVILKPLKAMSIFELDIAIAKIVRNAFFQAKDKKGKRMYSNALKHYRYFVLANKSNSQALRSEIQTIRHDPLLNRTEKEAIIKARIGQGEFRAKLLRKYNSSCIITNIKVPSVLIASHIKPWSVSSNSERLSSENGFILSATYDRLFDGGLISFCDNGKLLISSMITKDDAQILNLDTSKNYDIKYNFSMKNFLDYHRDVIFIK